MMLQPSRSSSNNPHLAQRVESERTNALTQAPAGSESKRSVLAQIVSALSHVFCKQVPLNNDESNTPSPSVFPLLELATEGAVINNVFQYLSLDQAKQAALTCKELSKPQHRHGIPHIFAPPLALIRKLIAQPQTWDRVVPGFTQLKLPPGITNEQLRSLVDSGHLDAVTELDLSGCTDLTDAGLAHLAELPNLTSLNLTGCHGITNAGLAHIAKLKNLTHLDLAWLVGITDAGLVDLAELPNLTSLSLAACRRITNAGLADLAKLTNLTSLNLTGCDQITDAGLAHLAKLKNLTSLNLNGFWNITHTGLVTLLPQLPNLKRLHLRNCLQINDADVADLRTAYPNLVIEDFH